MDWITNKVAIGNYREAQNIELLQQNDLMAILSLDGTLMEDQASSLGVVEIISIKLIDGEGNDIRQLRLAVDSLNKLVQSYPPVLVQCHAGRSRSVVVVAGYLMQTQGIEVEEAMEIITLKRDTKVTPCLITLLGAL